MREQTCCFTGHREIPAFFEAHLELELESVIHGLIARGIRYFGAGGALGFDTLAAQVILRLRATYPQIRLILVLPCRDQDRYWAEEQRKRYREIRTLADKTVYVSETYDRDCMGRRNQHLVDHSSICVAYCTRATGGTASTVRYALKKDLEVILLRRA